MKLFCTHKNAKEINRYYTSPRFLELDLNYRWMSEVYKVYQCPDCGKKYENLIIKIKRYRLSALENEISNLIDSGYIRYEEFITQ